MEILQSWNKKQKYLNMIIKKSETYSEAQQLFLSLHRSVHFSESSSSNEQTLMDELWEGLTGNDFFCMPTKKDVTIVWDLWHLTRIEDLTVNILIQNQNQVFNQEWQERLTTSVTDTGNAMSDEEIMQFSHEVNKEELKNYRIAVGRRTQEILQSLTFEDMKRTFLPEQAARIQKVGGVKEHPDSVWLTDFWGKKTVAGIILMPVTRHQIMHISDAFKLKESIRKRKSFYKI